jgi:hypothetical protein
MEGKLATLRQLPWLAGEPDPVRAYALRTAKIGQIALFPELTALYVGTFACAMATLLLVLIKEYTRDALGLQERDMLAGRVFDTLDEGELEADVDPVGTESSRPTGAVPSPEPSVPTTPVAVPGLESASQIGELPRPGAARDVGSAPEKGRASAPRRWTFLG